MSYHPAKNEYFSQASDDPGRHAEAAGCVEAAVFFDPALLRTYRKQGERSEIKGQVTRDGQPCSDLVIGGRAGGPTFHLFAGSDGLLRGMRMEIGGGLTIESRLRSVRPNAPIAPAVFAWRPPATAKTLARLDLPLSLSDALRDPGLTEAGRIAPNFPLASSGTGMESLSGLLRKKRLVLLTFWGFG